MNYRRMGRTGLQVSPMALGSSILYPDDSNAEVGIACIHRAFEAGINLFDTADAYEAGQTERVLGRALQELPREQVVVATKCWYPMWPGPLGKGLSRKHIVEAAEGSLRRLKIGYIDLYQAHQYDEQTPIDEALGAMDLLVRQGKVLYVGCSNFSAAQLCDANEVARERNLSRLDCIQPPYHLLDRQIERDLLPACRRHGIGVIVYSPLARGLLTGKYNTGKIAPGSSVAHAPAAWREKFFTPDNLTRLKKLKRLANTKGAAMGQIALAWILKQEGITSVIIGAQNPKQIDENVSALQVNLSECDLSVLEQIFPAISPPQSAALSTPPPPRARSRRR